MLAAWPPAQQRPAAGERGGQGPEDWAPSAPSHEERASPARLRATLVVNPRSGRLARLAPGIATDRIRPIAYSPSVIHKGASNRSHSIRARPT